MNDETALPGRSATSNARSRHDSASSYGLSLELPAAALEQLVERVAERVREELAGASPWMDRPAAAAYLKLPPSNLEKRRDVPSHRVGALVRYRRDELDEWLSGQ